MNTVVYSFRIVGVGRGRRRPEGDPPDVTGNGGVISIVGSATHAANGARGFLLTIEGPAIPEPSTVALLGAGAAIVALRRRRS